MASSVSSSLLVRTLSLSLSPNPNSSPRMLPHTALASSILPAPPSHLSSRRRSCRRPGLLAAPRAMAASVGSFSARRGGGGDSEPRETILLPGCDYNHWLIVMEFPKDPVPTREQMIDTYLNTLATVLGSMEEAKKNMYAFSTTTYTGFQCTVSEETSEKFKGLPGVLWVLPDSYIDVKNKDYGGDKYINGEIIPCKYPTYQPKERRGSKYESRRYERRRDGPPAERRRPRQETTQAETPSS